MVVPPRGPCETYIFEINFTLDLSYLFTKFGANRIEIVTCRVITHRHTHIQTHTHTNTNTHTHTHTHTHTENLSSREIGGDLWLPCLWGLFYTILTMICKIIYLKSAFFVIRPLYFWSKIIFNLFSFSAHNFFWPFELSS